MTRILLHSRSAQWALLAAFAMWVLAAVIGRRSMEIDLSATFPPTKLVVGELCVVVTATLLATLTRPQFWEWDRIACGARPRTVTVLLLTPPLTPLLAGATTVVLWLTGATALVAVAVVVHASTCGTTAWAHRRFGREHQWSRQR